jgi:hypothetical protein
MYFYKAIGVGDWNNIDGVFEIGRCNGECKANVGSDLQEAKYICQDYFRDM